MAPKKLIFPGDPLHTGIGAKTHVIFPHGPAQEKKRKEQASHPQVTKKQKNNEDNEHQMYDEDHWFIPGEMVLSNFARASSKRLSARHWIVPAALEWKGAYIVVKHGCNWLCPCKPDFKIKTSLPETDELNLSNLCLHESCVHELAQKGADDEDQPDLAEGECLLVNRNPLVGCVFLQESLHPVIGSMKDSLRCTCPSFRAGHSKCAVVSRFREWATEQCVQLEDFEEEEEEEMKETTFSGPIPFDLSEEIKQLMSMRAKRGNGATFQLIGQEFFAAPLLTACKCGNVSRERVEKEACAYFPTSSITFSACSLIFECGCTLSPHWWEEHGLMPLSKGSSTFLSIELLRGYLHHFHQGRTTLIGHHRALSGAYEDLGEKMVSYDLLRKGWNGFVSNLRLDLREAFSCSKCVDHPDILLFDGTQLSHRKDLLFLQDPKRGEPLETGSRHRERVLLPKSLQGLWQKFSTSSPSSPIKFDAEPFGGVDRSIKKLLSVISKKQDQCDYCDPNWAPFLREIGKNSPICAILPSPIWPLLKRMVRLITEPVLATEEDMRLLNRFSPCLFELLKIFGCALPSFSIPFFRFLLSVAQKAFESAVPDLADDGNVPASPLDLYPGLPLVRERGFFRADEKNGSKVEECRQAHDLCNKYYQGHPVLCAGILTCFCQHGICLGFSVMSHAESPDFPFTTLQTRLPQAPSVVIYDNACHLHTYCLNRDPIRYRGTSFYIDRFHSKNHTACSSGYLLDGRMDLELVNTQLVEQKNATLARLRSQLSYMTRSNFMKHAALFLAHQNRLEKKK